MQGSCLIFRASFCLSENRWYGKPTTGGECNSLQQVCFVALISTYGLYTCAKEFNIIICFFLCQNILLCGFVCICSIDYPKTWSRSGLIALDLRHGSSTTEQCDWGIFWLWVVICGVQFLCIWLTKVQHRGGFAVCYLCSSFELLKVGFEILATLWIIYQPGWGCFSCLVNMNQVG